MIVTIISQCEKKALTKTREILDAFANRIGDRAWQSVMTQEGLDAVQRLLRKTASKNTAVACHRNRGYSQTELVWIVGNRRKFNAEGHVPVNTTQKTGKQQHEDDWKILPLIRAITALAALFHDWGKATECFQNKLDASCGTIAKDKSQHTPSKHQGDPLRHEWISCVLLHTFVHTGTERPDDQEWLTRLEQGDIESNVSPTQIQPIRKPLAALPPAAGLIAWLVLSHHRLPLKFDKKANNLLRDISLSTPKELLDLMTAEFGYQNSSAEDEALLASCFRFPHGLLSQSQPWLRQLQQGAKQLKKQLPALEQALENGSWRLILHHCRLALMLGDHFYSSLPKSNDSKWDKGINLYANTEKEYTKTTTRTHLKQKLDEHLVQVSNKALNIVSLLPSFENGLPYAEDLRRLRKQGHGPFAWQDTAVKTIKAWRSQQPENQRIEKTGFFAVNTASTGCGKTVANAKIMRALSPNYDKLRYVLALGLRTLTLQTGDEYRRHLGVDDSQMAVLIGSQAVMNLHAAAQEKESYKEDTEEETNLTGSESQEPLWDGNVNGVFSVPEEGLSTLFQTKKAGGKSDISKKNLQLLYAPLLVCTIDHLMAATETKRGGKYILPCLRLMSSDLVIDEVDDFHGADLIAIGRLIHLAGMLGRKVMISSATIPPALAEGYFNAYREGWRLYAQAHGLAPDIGCAWIDEFKTQVETLKLQDTTAALQEYQAHHQHFIHKRVRKLADPHKSPVRRKGWIVDCDDLKVKEPNNVYETLEQGYFERIRETILTLHHRHASIDPHSGKKVSFGVVRVAHVDPCIRLTQYLIRADWDAKTAPKLMAYHSRQILLLRHEQEKHLDQVLKRKEKEGEPPRAFENPIIRQHLDETDAEHVLFIVVATPVEEVGRDHDFDWGVIEPSSYRSIIQMAGRIWRHRQWATEAANIALMQYNLKALKGAEVAYTRPGYEQKVNDYDGRFHLHSHDLTTLLADTRIEDRIDATPRIQPLPTLQPQWRLADLEHSVISHWLTSYSDERPHMLQGYLTQSWWMTALPQYFNAFRDTDSSLNLYCLRDEHYKEFAFYRKVDGVMSRYQDSYIKWEAADEWANDAHRLWLERNYSASLEAIAESQQQPLVKAAELYGEVNLPLYGTDSPPNYLYSDQFGFEII